MMTLVGKTVVLTRDAHGNKIWKEELSRLGAKVISSPTIRVSRMETNDQILGAFESLGSFDWLMFTSSNGVRFFQSIASELNIDLKSSGIKKVAALGPGTARAALSAGFHIDFMPYTSDSESLANGINLAKNTKVLLLRADIASDELPNDLRERGAIVADLKIYRTLPVNRHDPVLGGLLKHRKVDFIVFASPSAVAGLAKRLKGDELKLAKHVPAAAIGPSTEETLRTSGYENVHIARTTDINGIINLLQQIS